MLSGGASRVSADDGCACVTHTRREKFTLRGASTQPCMHLPAPIPPTRIRIGRIAIRLTHRGTSGCAGATVQTKRRKAARALDANLLLTIGPAVHSPQEYSRCGVARTPSRLTDLNGPIIYTESFVYL
ncbi:hypothetical protein EVAR_46258_1 [Eumeta japonica]|uniref:Uncharacterized protein n=1 Tax=Eumeta variegata TaxID=151549 RepID=A0A4C1Y7Z2_EUMVA|nr:hypothetical protein EVAR_46258_1 [Eumeta japonica]